ncbi:MAG: hypothetical protein CMF59_00595 [Leptospiraceae bacterium]|nr:hypothetical protein [Leptospiraceae bacterium]
MLIFDYRGSGRSDGNPNLENTYKDALAILTKANKRSRKNGISVFILAQSPGGAIVLRAIVDSEAHSNVALIIADSTFPSYRDLVERKARDLTFFQLSTLISLFFSNRKSPKETLSRIAPAPVLDMHSTDDPVVDFEHGQDLFDSLDSPRELYRIQVYGHLGWSNMGKSDRDQTILSYMTHARRAFSEPSPFPGEE